MKLASWNVYKSKYIDQVVEILASLGSDVIALQEITEQDNNGHRINSAQVIAERLGYKYTYCKAFTTDRHTPSYDLGNAILTKYPIIESSCQLLSDRESYQGSAESEPRVGLVTTVQLPNGKHITIVTTQLGYTPTLETTKLQESQLERLFAITPRRNTILLGDFNSIPQSSIVQQLQSEFVNTDNLLTKPSRTDRLGKQRVDYIFTSPEITASNFSIIDSDASDHALLTAEIEV